MAQPGRSSFAPRTVLEVSDEEIDTATTPDYFRVPRGRTHGPKHDIRITELATALFPATHRLEASTNARHAR